jgi:hypothetical protein
MDDLAPAPTQRTYDDAGRVREESFRARKKAVKKALPAISPRPDPKAEAADETDPAPEMDHELDLLA